MSFSSVLSGMPSNQHQHGNGQSEKAKEELKCSTCGACCLNLKELEIHITVDHLDWVPFQCYYCQFVRLPTEFTLRTHLRELHPTRDPMVVYKVNDAKREQLSNLIAQSLDLHKQTDASGHDADSGRPLLEMNPTTVIDDCEQFSAIRVVPSNPSQSTASHSSMPLLYDNRNADIASSIGSPQHHPDPPGSAVCVGISLSRTQSITSEGIGSFIMSPLEVKAEPSDSFSRNRSPLSLFQLGQSTNTSFASNQTPTQSVMDSVQQSSNGPPKSTSATNKGRVSSCTLCGDKITTANEQKDHVLRKHLEKRQLCCKICGYKTNIYNNAYMHASSTHKLRVNRMRNVIDLRSQFANETTSMIDVCFPSQGDRVRSLRRSFEAPKNLKTRSRMSLPASSSAASESVDLPSGSSSASRPKSTFATATLVCVECSARIKGNGYANFEQHSMRHFHVKRYQCDACSFATNHKRPADAHASETDHEVKNKRLELHEQLQKIVFRCFPQLPKKIGLFRK
uniref:C2H2-type domain-containing protein n=1 Tax=Plectus sambesii TaxID=2011161 RepID=A0A914WR02_9BILA